MEHPSTDCGAPSAKSDINSNENGGCEVSGLGRTAWRCQQVEKAAMACAALRPPRYSPKHTGGIHVMAHIQVEYMPEHIRLTSWHIHFASRTG